MAISKYVDHLPLYRQEAIYARSGVDIGRTSLAEWMGAAGVALRPMVAVLRNELLGHHVLHADETPVAMLDPGAGKTRRAYLFAYRTATNDPIVVFDFCTSRSGRHARDFLGDYRGALMVDDYAGYKALLANGVTELGCWVHERRLHPEVVGCTNTLSRRRPLPEGQRPRSACVAHRCAHAAADDQGSRHRDLAAASVAAGGLSKFVSQREGVVGGRLRQGYKRQNPTVVRRWGFAFKKTLAMTYSCMA